MDPLSITAAVATLLGCCITAGVALRKFLIGASEVKMVVQAMMADLRALRSVLETMEITFEEMNSDKPAEGHIGAHWVDLFQSLGDSQQSIVSLQIVLEEVGKDVKFMDSTRKQIRIKTAADQIAICRQEVQTYKDALQLSLHSITVWNTHNIKGTTDELLETSRATNQDLQRLATNVELKLTALQTLFQQSNELGRLGKLSNLTRTMNSAATVVSGHTTDVADLQDLRDVTSDYGDMFDFAASQFTLDWVYPDRLQEPGLAMRDQSQVARAERPAERSDVQSLPVHQEMAHHSSLMPKIMTTTDSSDLTLPSSSIHIDVISRSAASAPALLGPQMLIQAERGDDEISKGENAISGIDKPEPASTGSRLQLSSADLPPEKTKKKPHRRGLSWFRSKKSDKLPSVRSPMDPQLTWSTWRRLKLPVNMKLVFVGDGGCGKTCLIIMITKGAFPEVYVPTVFENYVADVEMDGQEFSVEFWDTAGQEDYDRLRPLCYPNADAAIISFAIDSPDSLDNVKEKWTSEVSHFCKGLPTFLVGCKKDLRYDQKTINELQKSRQAPVTIAEAEKARDKIGAIAYIETSARTGEGASLAIATIMREVIEYKLTAATKKRARQRS